MRQAPDSSENQSRAPVLQRLLNKDTDKPSTKPVSGAVESTSSHIFMVGQPVDMLHESDDDDTEKVWRCGKVAFVRAPPDGQEHRGYQYDVVLESGDKESKVDAAALLPHFEELTVVESRFSALDTWFSAIVIERFEKAPDNCSNSEEPWYEVVYAEGNVEIMPVSCLRPAMNSWQGFGTSFVGLPVHVLCQPQNGTLQPASSARSLQRVPSMFIEGKYKDIMTEFENGADIQVVTGQIAEFDYEGFEFAIVLDNGEIMHGVHAHQLRPHFVKGYPVEARFRGLNRWFCGIIRTVHYESDGKTVNSCDVQFAANHISLRVSTDLLRVFGSRNEHSDDHESASNESHENLDEPVETLLGIEELAKKSTSSELTHKEAVHRYVGTYISDENELEAAVESHFPGPHPLAIGSAVEHVTEDACSRCRVRLLSRVKHRCKSYLILTSFVCLQIVACRSNGESFTYDVCFIKDPDNNDQPVDGEASDTKQQNAESPTVIRNVPADLLRQEMFIGSHVQIWMAGPENGWRMGVVVSGDADSDTFDVWLSPECTETAVARQRIRQPYWLSAFSQPEDSESAPANAPFSVGSFVTVLKPAQWHEHSKTSADANSDGTKPTPRVGIVVGMRHSDGDEPLVWDITLGSGCLLLGLPTTALEPVQFPPAPAAKPLGFNNAATTAGDGTTTDSSVAHQAEIAQKIFEARDIERRKHIVAQLQTQALRVQLEKALDRVRSIVYRAASKCVSSLLVTRPALFWCFCRLNNNRKVKRVNKSKTHKCDCLCCTANAQNYEAHFLQ